MFRFHGTFFRGMYGKRTLLTRAFKIIQYTFCPTEIRGYGIHYGCSDFRDVLCLYRLRMKHWVMLCWQFSYIPCSCLCLICVIRYITKLNALHYSVLRTKPI
jgi:hypothetical protein